MIISNKEALYAFVKSTGICLVHILDTDELFAFSKFVPAEGNLKKHILEGKDVSDYFHQNSPTLNFTNIEIQKQSILTKIDSLPTVRREFSHHMKWTSYH